MTFVHVLTLPLGILIACLAAAIGYFVRMYWRESIRFRRQLRARIQGRTPKAVERIFFEDWQGPPVDYPRFKELWKTAAACFQLEPEIMRPDDKINRLFVYSEFFWFDHDGDIAEFFLDCLPGCRPYELAAHEDYETVSDLVTSVIVREART